MTVPRLIIFDLDGTLIQSHIEYEKIRQRLREVLKQYVSPEYYQKILTQKVSILELIQLIEKFSASEEVASKAMKIVEDYEFKGYQNAFVHPATYKVLKELKNRDIKIAILTNNSKKLTDFALKKYELSDYIDAVITRDDVKKRKPDPEGINILMKKFDVKRTETIFVGDAWLDIEAAENANVQFIWIVPQNHNLDSVKAEYKVIHKIEELLEVIFT